MTFEPPTSRSSSLLLYEYGIAYRSRLFFTTTYEMITEHSPTRTLGRFSARPGMVKLQLVSRRNIQQDVYRQILTSKALSVYPKCLSYRNFVNLAFGQGSISRNMTKY